MSKRADMCVEKWERTVVGDGLVGVEDEGVALTGVDLDGINDLRLVVDTISFNDGHSVIIDREDVVGIATYVEKAEAVPLALSDRDDCESGGGIPSVTTKAID
jgi:hypothetical protein